MALTESELTRIRHELGYNLLTTGAEPWIGVHAVFSQVIQPYLRAGAATTSATAVTAASTPTPVTLTLADATGFAAGVRVVVDVDSRQEIATVQSLTGSTITLLLTKVHSGTYPVTVEGGESIVREILGHIAAVKTELGSTFGYGALKRVDEIEFYESGEQTLFGKLGDQLRYWRSELASALGISSMWDRQRAAGATLAVY